MNYNIYALNNKTLFDICVVVPSRAYLYGVKSKKKKKKTMHHTCIEFFHIFLKARLCFVRLICVRKRLLWNLQRGSACYLHNVHETRTIRPPCVSVGEK